LKKEKEIFYKEGFILIKEGENKTDKYVERYSILKENEMKIYEKKEGKIINLFLLKEFSLQKVGNISISSNKSKEKIKAHVFTLIFEDFSVVFGIEKFEEFSDWIETLYLIENKNFALSQQRDIYFSFKEENIAKLRIEFDLFNEQKIELIDKIGDEKYSQFLKDYQDRLLYLG
jgi:hypothetical protein